MAVDAFLKLTDIDGESVDEAHKGEIDVLAWSWGMSQSGTMHMATGGGAGKANVQDMSFTHWLDKASPNLMKACASGAHIKEAVLTCRSAGKEPLEYLIITMEQCIVTSVQLGGSGGEDRFTENFTLNFARVGVDYQPQSATGAKEGGVIEFAGDIAENVYT
jgi:type VI secretion system secreted protein Hcp